MKLDPIAILVKLTRLTEEDKIQWHDAYMALGATDVAGAHVELSSIGLSINHERHHIPECHIIPLWEAIKAQKARRKQERLDKFAEEFEKL